MYGRDRGRHFFFIVRILLIIMMIVYARNQSRKSIYFYFPVLLREFSSVTEGVTVKHIGKTDNRRPLCNGGD